MIKKFREQLGKKMKEEISQRRLAELIGVETKTVSQWEQGARYPRREFRVAMRELGAKHRVKIEFE